MSIEWLAFPSLFLAIFFESFVLVTLLSKPARAARARTSTSATPSVAVIVPCYNEASTISATCESLLALDYPSDKLEIILVDDGSTDGTGAAMDRFATHPQVRIIHKANGGKHTALNAGITATQAMFIGCLDADSFVEPSALKEIIGCFADPNTAAATAAMSVHRPKSLLEHMQNAEYIFGITFRHAISSINGMYVTPGPFSFYRRSVIEEVGGFRHGHQTEDMEMALRLQRAGYGIENSPRARVYTKVPRTLLTLVKQRTRWASGFLRNIFGEYRDFIGNPRRGALGTIILPTALVSVFSTILLFFFALFELVQRTTSAVSVRTGVPLSYTLLPRGSFDWFFLPATTLTLLGLATLVATLALIVAGKRISRTPGSLAFGLISYSLLYAFVVPLWLVRSTIDVTFGTRRLWR